MPAMPPSVMKRPPLQLMRTSCTTNGDRCHRDLGTLETAQGLKTRLVGLAAAAQVRLDQQLGTTAETEPIDLDVLHDALHVVARFRERDALHPIDRIDIGIAR